MKNLYALLFLTVIFASCTKDSADPIQQTNTDGQDLDRVTGFQVTDSQGQEIVRFGNPNEKDGGAAAYPVPCSDILTLGFGGQYLDRVWFVPADSLAENQAVDFDSLYQDLTYSLSGILALSQNFSVAPDSAEAIALDVSSFANGYYKVFYRYVDQTIYSKNIHIRHGATISQAYNSEMDAFWN